MVNISHFVCIIPFCVLLMEMGLGVPKGVKIL